MATENIGIHVKDTDNETVKLNDSGYLCFGSGADGNDDAAYDIRVAWDGTDLDVTQYTANSSIKWGIDGAGIDQVWYGDTASAYMMWDQSADDLILAGGAGLVLNGSAGLKLGDDIKLAFGASDDVTLDWNASGGLDVLVVADNSLVTVGTGTLSADLKWFGGDTSTYIYFNADGGSGTTGEWAFGVNDHGVDVVLYGATSGSLALWDESANELVFDGADLWLKDDDTLEFGDSSDVVLYWAAGGVLTMVPAATDTKWYIGTGTYSFDIEIAGSTGTNNLKWDCSANTLYIDGVVHVNDFNTLPSRYELQWIAGKDGLPVLNNDAFTELVDPRFEVLGTNASADDVVYYAEGGIKLTTDGADHDQVIILPHLDSAQSPWTETTWGTDQETTWECYIKTGANITATVIWAGLKLTNTSVTATDNDQAFFRYQDTANSGKWQAVSSINGSDDAADSGVTVAINTDYHLKIAIGATRVAEFYINGALVETSAALTDATDLIPYIGVQTEGAGPGAGKDLIVRGQAISRKFA